MFRSYSKKMIEHAWELLSIYESALKHIKFDRNQIASDTNIPMLIVEGRWYTEIKRTSKYGVQYDWKTMLNDFVLRKLKDKENCVGLIYEMKKLFRDPEKY